MTLTGFLLDLILDWDDIPSYEHLAKDEPEEVVYDQPRPGRIVRPSGPVPVLPKFFGNGSGLTRGQRIAGGFGTAVFDAYRSLDWEEATSQIEQASGFIIRYAKYK
jgi:hypothetical protein